MLSAVSPPATTIMFCHRCLSRLPATSPSSSPSLLVPLGAYTAPSFTYTRPRHHLPRHSRTVTTTPPAALPSTTPFSTPIPKATVSPAVPRSAALKGTQLTGLGHLKGKPDPVAGADDEYPEWLWGLLDVGKKNAEGAEAEGVGDLFCEF